MTQQKQRIIESVNYLNNLNPFRESVNLAMITHYNPKFLKIFKINKRIRFSNIPPKFTITNATEDVEFLFATLKNSSKKIFIFNGRLNYYDGFEMREVAHLIYVLKFLGVKVLILINEVGFLNPRFKTGEVALIYDHINLMGYNPLIGENDNTIGTRFPDMSNAYDSKLYEKAEKVLNEKKIKYYPSVYLGLMGPETETQAECRFYRDIGADVLGYSIVPENISAVHCGLKCLAFGMISRELVADRLTEISTQEKLKNRQKAELSFSIILGELISRL